MLMASQIPIAVSATVNAQRRDIRQHAMTEVVRLVAGPLVAGQIVCGLLAMAWPLGSSCRPGGWADVRGRNLSTTCSSSPGNRPLGFHWCRSAEHRDFI